ncbi:MAG: sigma-70 family RNA polymerase sigma factor [Rubinisphaera brasiliensis]|uniref:sigma-70 family RNA polymerase sigma factor n=1 Tax=Rubinisphaera brasiliensis TaxID=119 RepID=UPI00391DB2CA
MNASETPDWLSGMQAGQTEALSKCFAEYRPRLERIAQFRLSPRLSTRIDVDDVLQETYLAAAKRLPHCDASSPETVFVWLRLLVQQTLVDLHRKHLQAAGRDIQREVRADRTDPGTSGCIAAHLVAQISSPSLSLRREEMNERLMKALEKMEPTDREVLALRHFEELSNGEVAKLLNLSIKAASIRYVRAMKKLKVFLDDLPEGSFLP